MKNAYEKNLKQVVAILFSIVKELRLTKIFLIFTLSFLISSLIHPIQASITITEVYPNPVSGENEWVELHNNTSEAISVHNWQLKDVLSSPSVAYQFQNVIIEAGMYYVAHLSSQKLNNTADGVTLFDSNGQLVDEMNYNSSESSKSWAKQLNATWVLDAPSKGFDNPSPTPTPTPTPTPSPTPSTTPQPSTSPSTPPNNTYQSLKIVSFSPCPSTGGSESIEINNTSSTQMEITNWKIIDKDDNYKSISGIIAPQTNTLISWSGSLLNNAGDSLTVLTDSGTELLSTIYGECEKGLPFTFFDNEWQQQSEAMNTNDTKTVTSLGASEENDQRTKISTIDKNTITKEESTSIAYPQTASPSSIVINTTETPMLPSKHTLIEPAPEISKYGIINVIIGGSLVSFSGALQLYEKIRLFKTQFLV